MASPRKPLIPILILTFCWHLHATSDWTDTCPTACYCKWSSGKKTAMCRDAGYTTIPDTLNSDLQVLDLTGNAIPYLSESVFKSVDLINLQKIFLRNARVHEVHKHAFRDLIILVELDLSDNLLVTLHPDTFAGNLRLRLLILSGNPLSTLHDRQFAKLPHLKVIELHGCQLRHIHENAFFNVPGLETLDLKDNNLSQLSESVFVPITKLKTLTLDGNPWQCDCHLRDFRNWFLSSNLHSTPLTCNGPPPRKNRSWESVPPFEFACGPKILIHDDMIHAREGENITLACHVLGDPEPEVTWLFNDDIIGFTNATRDSNLIIEVEDGLVDKWINLTMYNATNRDSGVYTCLAKNVEGLATKKIHLLFTELVKVASLNKKEGDGFAWIYAAIGSSVVFTIVLLAVAVHCRGRRRSKNIKVSVSFTDQEKKLLDLSITTRAAQSDEGCSANDSVDVWDQDTSSLATSGSAPLDVYEPCVDDMTISHFYQGPYPAPPPEFSSVLPIELYGNVLISVAVEPDLNQFPDLLDIPHRSNNTGKFFTDLRKSGSVCHLDAVPDMSFCLSSVIEGESQNYATLPRKVRGSRLVPKYDNMGPRITAAGSCQMLNKMTVDGAGSPQGSREVKDVSGVASNAFNVKTSGFKGTGALGACERTVPTHVCSKLAEEYVSL